MRQPWSTLLACVIGVALGDLSAAQTRPTTFPPSFDPRPVDPDVPSADDVSGLKTTVEFQILGDGPSAGLDAQRWVEMLQPFGVTVRVRTPKAGDELGVDENIRGTLRWVIATGQLDEGRLTFPDRSFRIGQRTELKEWIDELKLYGAQGAPSGKPLWGLTATQFNEVFAALSLPVVNRIEGMPLEVALQQMELPAEMPVRYHSTAIKQLTDTGTPPPVRPRVQGLTGGTALAAVLANYGLGFRPMRTPAGTIELLVEPIENLKQPWPIGWEPDKQASRGKMAPGLFKMVPVGFNDVPLNDILAAVAEVGEIPVVINHHAAAGKGIDLSTPVSYPQKKSAYMMVLSSVVRRQRLTHDLRIDERGTPFVYVTAFVPRTIEELSPAESD